MANLSSAIHSLLPKTGQIRSQGRFRFGSMAMGIPYAQEGEHNFLRHHVHTCHMYVLFGWDVPPLRRHCLIISKEFLPSWILEVRYLCRKFRWNSTKLPAARLHPSLEAHSCKTRMACDLSPKKSQEDKDWIPQRPEMKKDKKLIKKMRTKIVLSLVVPHCSIWCLHILYLNQHMLQRGTQWYSHAKGPRSWSS